MPHDPIHAFLLSIAQNAGPNYQNMLSGIADWWQMSHSLTPKQLLAVNISANIQGRTLPPGLLDQSLDPASREPLEDMLGGPLPVTGHVLADLCSEIASALTKAAERLR